MNAAIQFHTSHGRSPIIKQQKIDQITFDAEEKQIVLHLIEDLTDEIQHDQAKELEDKVLTYIEYVYSGNLIRDYPNAMGQSFRFQIDCFERPGGKIKQIIETIAQTLYMLGICFRVKTLE